MEDTNKVIQDISHKTEEQVKAMRETGKLYEPKLELLINSKVTRTAGKVINNGNFTGSQSNNRAAAEKGMEFMMNFMNQGAKEFEERTGRPMTYAEMRSMFG